MTSIFSLFFAALSVNSLKSSIMSVVSESIPFEPNFQPLQQLQRRPRRRRCRTWNFTSTIPIEERRQENLVKGEAVVCISKDHSMLMVMILFSKFWSRQKFREINFILFFFRLTLSITITTVVCSRYPDHNVSPNPWPAHCQPALDQPAIPSPMMSLLKLCKSMILELVSLGFQNP